MNLSIIIPFHNEEEDAEAVIGEVLELHPDAEIVAVDDGSTDNTPAVLSQIRGIKVITLPQCIGQSGALYRGLMEARGDILVLMDGDGQSSTPDIERLLKYIPEYDFVNGLRAGRRDSLARRLSSGFANSIRSRFLGDGMRDTGGSPKIMKKICVDHLVAVDGMHRFIPAMLAAAGFRSIEVPVQHRERRHGTTKYTNFQRGA
ncbi:MAG: glycosyltransferase, partial [Myxococcota bacterium]